MVDTYKLLLEKLKNNQHPDIQLRILQHELTEVESTQEEFRTLLHNVFNKFTKTHNNNSRKGILCYPSALSFVKVSLLNK